MGRTMPPRRIVTATGAEGGAYQEIGKRYQAILARAGVQLRLMPTDGALQNLAMLRDSHSGVDIALIQGGTTSEAEAPDIESLGIPRLYEYPKNSLSVAQKRILVWA